MNPLPTVARRLREGCARLPAPLRRAASLTWQATRLWTSQDGTELGAAIAFYSMFALAPLLVIAIALAGAVFGPEAARGQIVGQIADLVGLEAARGIEAMIAASWRTHATGTAALVGVATLLVGASGVFAQLRKALNRIGRVPLHPSALGAYLRARLMAFALVLGVGFLILASLLLSAAVSAVVAWISRQLPLLAAMLTLTDLAVSLGVLTVAFWTFLRWLPDRGPGSRAAWVGAAVSALLFAAGKHLIGLYLGRVSTTSTFGAAGSLVVVMSWVFYSSQILLFGAALAYAMEGVRAEHQTPPGS